MVYIFVLITGIGDGLAEPIGIYLGRHKYYGETYTCTAEQAIHQRWLWASRTVENSRALNCPAHVGACDACRCAVTSCFSDRRYQRSWEGSACVFISSIVFVSCFWYTFRTPLQFWTAMVVLPLAMAYAEATSPHTVDTPMLMAVGGSLLWIISHVKLKWQ